jgi:hypothetical protein
MPTERRQRTSLLGLISTELWDGRIKVTGRAIARAIARARPRRRTIAIYTVSKV